MTDTPLPADRPPASGARFVALIRCRVCGRATECAPGELAAIVHAAPRVCCGVPLELFMQAQWPTQGSGRVTVPPPRRVSVA